MSVGEIRLMLVDDHLVLREGLKFMLRSEPDVVIVDEAADGSEALERIAASLPDVVVLDISPFDPVGRQRPGELLGKGRG